MTNTNHFVFTGNVVREIGEADFGYLASGTARLNFTIAVNRSKKQGDEWVDEASFFDVAYFGKGAENVKQYITKGTKVCVAGYVKQDRWTDKEGNKKYKVNFIAESVELCGGNRVENNNNNQFRTFQPINNNDGFAEDIPYSDNMGDILF